MMRKVVAITIVLLFLGSLGAVPISGASTLLTNEGAQNVGSKIVFGFWPNWAPDSYDPPWDKLTHVAYFAMFAEPDGGLDTSNFTEAKYWRVHDKAKKYGVKVLITVAAHKTMDQEEILENSKHIDNLVNNIFSTVEKYDADGIILDFENYNHETNGMLQLVERLHSRLSPKYQLFICVSSWIEPMYRDKSLAEYVDGVFLMAYDFHIAEYSPDPNKEWAHYTGAVAPYDRVKEAVNKLERYYPEEKIILGVPLYGYNWTVLEFPTQDSPNVERAPVDGTGVTMDKAIRNASQHVRAWDTKSKTPWYFYENTTTGKYHQVWYEDITSLTYKFDYASDEDLGGIGFWALSYEGNSSSTTWREFWHLVGDKFWSPQISISEISFDKPFYLPGDKVTMRIKVVGARNLPIDAKVSASVFVWSLIKQELVESFELEPAGETGIYVKTFAIPESWLPGFYKVEVSATNIAYGNAKKSMGFVLIMPVLVEPTNKNPVYAGSPNNPKPFRIKLSTGVSHLDASTLVKKVLINHRINARFRYLETDSKGYAIYEVQAPPMSKEGKYDLTIELYNGLEITEKDAIVYGSSNNVDVVLVIDSSGSMHSYSGCNWFTCVSWKGSDDNDLRLKAAKMLVDTMNEGDGIAIVDFDRGVRYYPPDKKVLYLSTPEDKENLKSFIDTIDASGGTYIGVGLKTAYDIILNSEDTYPKYVMLLTDGDDNSGDPYNPLTVAEWFKDKGWKVYTIGLTSGWYTSENRPFLNSDLLMKIADITGGRYYEAKKAEVLLQIYNSIKGIAKNRNTISSKSVELKPGESTTQSIFVDPTVKAGEFSIAWSGSEFNLTLTAPDGSIITPEVAQTNPNITYIKGDTYIIYEVENPLPGKWKMNITAVNVPGSGENVTAMVLADTNLTVDLFTEKNTYKLGEPIRLVGVLALNGEAVNGEVDATVVKPDGGIESLQLLDDNKDGVYEIYYVPDEAGSYTITLQATGEVNGNPFTRETTFSVYVSSEEIPQEFRASVDRFKATTVSGRTVSLSFTLNSTIQDVIRVGLTSFSNGTSSFAVNYTSTPGIISLVPDENVPVTVDLTLPFNVASGVYRGEVVIQGTNSVLTIPVEIEILPRLRSAPENVTLDSTDVGVDSIEVYEISKDVLKQITGDIPEVENSRAFIIASTGFGSFRLRIEDIEGENIKVFGYNFESKEWKPMSFERGSVILPLSVNGFSLDLVVIGMEESQEGSTILRTNIILLPYVWTTWFFEYYDEFEELYENATALGFDNETLTKALELHQNATALLKKAWRTEDLESVRSKLWKQMIMVPNIIYVGKAYLMEREAVKTIKKVINEKNA